MGKQPDNSTDSPFNALDLSQLQDISLGPDWADEKKNKPSQKSYQDHSGEDRRQGRRDQGSAPQRRDRRRGGAPQKERPREEREYKPFVPPVDVIFVSKDKPFEMLLKAMRTTHKTYELFEIARIVLGKENRFTVIINPKEGDSEKKLFVSMPDQLPFDNKDEAINHVLNHHLDKFFTIEEVEVEPPKGNFQQVAKCSLTGKLLAPPNYHRYQEILKEHHAQNIRSLSFERFLEKVETVRDEESINAWLDSMKTVKQYTTKVPEGSEETPDMFQTLEEVKFYLLEKHKSSIYQAKDKIRLPGEKVEELPRGNIRRSIEMEHENQQRFPLVTSNHLRGRLRRCNLNFFKKGAKGITYVCAVKRKPRYKDTVFSESIQSLIDFIDSKQGITGEELLDAYLKSAGIEATEDAKKRAHQDLRWLVSEGYVTEFADGKLFAEKALNINAADDKSRQQREPHRGQKAETAPAKPEPEATLEPVEEKVEAESVAQEDQTALTKGEESAPTKNEQTETSDEKPDAVEDELTEPVAEDKAETPAAEHETSEITDTPDSETGESSEQSEKPDSEEEAASAEAAEKPK